MAHSAPFLEVPNYKAVTSFQIMKLRPQGCRPPPSPPPLPPLLPSSPQKAPSVPTLKKSSIWLERNDLLVNRTSWIREPWVLTFVLWRRAQEILDWIGQGQSLDWPRQRICSGSLFSQSEFSIWADSASHSCLDAHELAFCRSQEGGCMQENVWYPTE